MIYFLPIENMVQRYSIMMNYAFKATGKVQEVYPEFNYPEVIESGQFLDVNKTIIFKTKQMNMVAEMFYRGEIKNGDIFLIGDIFYPGIEAIRYMAELQNIDISVYGFNYAGWADETDFIHKCSDWAFYSDFAYNKSCDGIFVGSEFHKQNLLKTFSLPASRIHVTGYIWDLSYVKQIYSTLTWDKENYVIWPHRPAAEKGFEEFLIYAAKNPDTTFLVTSSGNIKIKENLPKNVKLAFNLTKRQYYELLAKAKYYLSTAYQETFGYTLQEAIWFQCKVAVPNRACYPEMVPKNCLYDNFDDIEYHHVPLEYTERWDGNVEKVLEIIENENNSRRK
jgi:glycosyltransferase involved in cell wall biosynthesis